MTALEVDITTRLGSVSLGVSFAIEQPREIMALLGPSGCGKSMTLKCIAGIERPDSGRIVLDGRTLFDSAARIDLPPQQRRVGYLFQSYALFPTMSVEQNVQAGGAVYVSHNRDEVYRMCDTVCVLDHGHSDAKVGVRELFAAPATLAAALISGCKNVSRAHAAGPGLLACEDWGVTLRTSLPGPAGVTHAGIRAHYFETHGADDASDAVENAIPCTVERVIDSTFSTIVMARTPGSTPLRYECEKDDWAALGNPARLVLVAPPATVMPLVSSGNGGAGREGASHA